MYRDYYSETFLCLSPVFQQRGGLCLSGSMGLLSRFSQEEPFDLSQKPGLRLSQSDGESVPGSSCQEEEDEESLYRRSQYSPEVDQQEPASEDQYVSEMEEKQRDCPDELRPNMMQEEEKSEKSLREERLGEDIDPADSQVELVRPAELCESNSKREKQERNTTRMQTCVLVSEDSEQEQAEQRKLQPDDSE
ncbi:hypothetical protein OJAV_G00087790 [Oryzias javanicus]|uniref:Uncharacterized protein n=1 Tax=Oryzias javanicus TaxID=123683 RepID=A0A437CZ88_ORYJA|nr:hypothetical protein OJAV_G00087790 [Oryzias javanicus]